ncbi:hypothetical protein P4S93_17470 [Aneurinibacillus thermoaerophilus]|jgi:predicted DNA repair protein MutK|uniref:Uncharacterized protein n=1 Tax=Aneurinibacillus thermoaerophilus TaxID=143495 RepID=A0A1G8FF14_ANETH|nr:MULTISPECIES: hypothetical protein [Aneurinibacillus]MED0677598.1 hypothetical protein [Aneurinibacillus thermoaerophilus]MED0757426.1 hypothetical protein [Aneurinibacillus thermoaerophilus]MED0762525.1 hypothetical protein [Aneurinibacillus thermoaerophilus]QYY43103.1 hypothetical protein K3F53_01970 [Aneurinibacillus thermoaerophilus]SDH80632.1 hypothetical protein SAMN04489735_106410 [Aneurinibacillus thermoaerophilus]
MDLKDWAITIASVLGCIKLGFEIAEKFEERWKKWKKEREKKKKRSTKKRKR